MSHQRSFPFLFQPTCRSLPIVEYLTCEKREMLSEKMRPLLCPIPIDVHNVRNTLTHISQCLVSSPLYSSQMHQKILKILICQH